MTQMTTVEAPSHGAAPAGASCRYLTFMLGHEAYGIEVLRVRGIVHFATVTPVPQMPAHIRGVMNLRGKIIPVADLRVRFGLGGAETSERTCIVVVQFSAASGARTEMGLLVSAVEEVLSISGTDIEETPSFGTNLDTEYIQGIAKVKGKVIILVDIDRVLTTANLAQLEPSPAE